MIVPVTFTEGVRWIKYQLTLTESRILHHESILEVAPASFNFVQEDIIHLGDDTKIELEILTARTIESYMNRMVDSRRHQRPRHQGDMI